jgi:hypothetical protein
MKATCQAPDCDRPAEVRGACRPHASRLYRRGTLEPSPKRTPMQRIRARIVERPGQSGPPCWIYTGRDVTSQGYCRVKVDGKRVMVHRWMWEQVYGPIAPGLEIDHLCRVPACCNPEHLEPVTPRENQRRSFSPWGINARKTHCKRGHEFTPENTYLVKGTGRSCKECRRIRQATYQPQRSERQRARRAALREEA